MTKESASSSSVQSVESDEAAVAGILSAIGNPWTRTADCVRALAAAVDRGARPSPGSTCLAALGMHLARPLAARFESVQSMSDPVWAILRSTRPDWLARASASGEAVWQELAEQVDAAASRLSESAGTARPIAGVLRGLGAIQDSGIAKHPPYSVRQAVFRGTGPGGLDVRAGRRCEMNPKLSADVRQVRLDPHAPFADGSSNRRSP